jgi:translation initiation factor IF-3
VVKTTDALSKAMEEGLTLVEIAASAKPPVAKIVDYGKFRYQEEKKLKKQSKGAKGGELKEIRFSPFIGEADYAVRIKRVREFLGEKNKVKIVVVFLGRQMNSKPFGYKLIERIKADLGENISVDMEPKFLGRHLITIISPYAKSKIKENNNQ